MDFNPYAPPGSPDVSRPVASPQPVVSRADWRATLSLILGAIAFPLYCVPPVCFGLIVASFLLGILGCRSRRWPAAVLGIAFSVITLALESFFLWFAWPILIGEI